MKSVGQGSLVRKNKFQLFSGKDFLNPPQIIPILLKCHLLIAHPCSSLKLFWPAMEEPFSFGVMVLAWREKTFLKMCCVSMAHKTTDWGAPSRLGWSTGTGLRCLRAVDPGVVERHCTGEASACQQIQVTLKYCTPLGAKSILFLQQHPHVILCYQKLRLADLTLAQ